MRVDGAVLEAHMMGFCCNGFKLSRERLFDNHIFWSKNADIEYPPQHEGESCRFFAWLLNVAVVAVRLFRGATLFPLVPTLCFTYDFMRLR